MSQPMALPGPGPDIIVDSYLLRNEVTVRDHYTWTNSMPVIWQNAFQSAAWWPRFITS